MSLFTLPKQVAVDSSGQPYPGALLYFYAAGGLTYQAVYTDSALSVAHSQPVVADANGVFAAIYLKPDSAADYRIQLKDADGVLLYDQDNVPKSGWPTQAQIGAIFYPETAAETAAAVTPTYYYYEPGDVRRYGAVGDGITDDTAAVSAALSVSATHAAYLPSGTYKISSMLSLPDYGRLEGDGRNSVLLKVANIDMLEMGKQSGIYDVRLNGNSGSYTGRGIVISVGDNTTTLADQGHQKIVRCFIDTMSGYPIEYTTANKGWMSHVSECVFEDFGSDAAVKWPDEPTAGGNRVVADSYCGDKPIVNASGCDNGVVSRCVTGGSATTGQGVYFPSGTTNRAKKVIMSDNRFAIASGTMDLRGIDCILTGNIIAGGVTFTSNAANDGATNWTYDRNIITGTLTDSSAATNHIRIDAPVSFTPTWTSTGTAPDFGNADVRCEYTRNGALIFAKYFIKFGSTTTFGTGTYYFSLPVARYVATTTDFCGSAYLNGQAGVSKAMFQTGADTIGLFDSSGAAVAHNSPITWANGNVIVAELQYRIFSG